MKDMIVEDEDVANECPACLEFGNDYLIECSRCGGEFCDGYLETKSRINELEKIIGKRGNNK